MAIRRRAIPPDPQKVKLSDDQRSDFLNWLVNELRLAVDARSRYIADGGYIDTFHALYEQAERPVNTRPWPDAADLCSYIPTEKVDALRARLTQIVFGADPICTVEGWGLPAQAVAKIEAFHQWTAEDERLQSWVAKAVHQALIEQNGVLEVSERIELTKTRGPFDAMMQTDEHGSPMLDESGQPIPATDEAGMFVPHDGGDSPKVSILREKLDYAARGPMLRLHSLKDFLFLPGHAKDASEVWGYAKRFYRRGPQLQQRVQAGLYDADAVDGLGESGERDPRPEHQRQGVTIASQQGPTAEHELWEVQLLHDIDGDGIEEWLIATVSVRHTQLLRVAYDSVHQARYVSFCPFPRSDSVYGYSFVGHKLWTLAEEHTALRNMKADRQALALNAPMMKLSTSEYDPDEEPWGPGAFLTVRSMNELQQLVVTDVPPSTIESERSILSAAERLSMVSDAGITGVSPGTQRTATELNLVTFASTGRIDEVIHTLQESLEDVYLLRHELWKRALQQAPGGYEVPDTAMRGLETRGIELPKSGPYRFTAEDLRGTVRFKPKGSVETADYRAMRQDYAQMMQGLGELGKMFPQAMGQVFQNPEAFRELFEQLLRLFRVPNTQVFLQASPQVAAPQGVLPQGPGGMPMGGGLPALLAALGQRGASPAGPPGVPVLPGPGGPQ